MSHQDSWRMVSRTFILTAKYSQNVLRKLDTVFQNGATFIETKVAHPMHVKKKWLSLLHFWTHSTRHQNTSHNCGRFVKIPPQLARESLEFKPDISSSLSVLSEHFNPLNCVSSSVNGWMKYYLSVLPALNTALMNEMNQQTHNIHSQLFSVSQG